MVAAPLRKANVFRGMRYRFGLWPRDGDVGPAGGGAGEFLIEGEKVGAFWRGGEMEGVGEIHAGFGPFERAGDETRVLGHDAGEAEERAESRDDLFCWKVIDTAEDPFGFQQDGA
jgi:hypothetical protein